ncbi:MAG TPA: GatB/YqeY domain-containing protein [Candidatus Binataceae bacterium]|nr:GatB/YqeY domain-containing protein [Candidatus Binataceae bacterium]
MKQKLQEDLKTAMKSGERLRVLTLRGILAEITRLEKDVLHEATEAEVIQIIKRERARRNEALEFARQAARSDLIEQNEAEVKILDGYLPTAIGPDEVSAAIAEAINSGVNQIGPIMKVLRDRFGARLDGKLASELVKKALAGL